MSKNVEELNLIQSAVKQQIELLTRQFNKQISALRADIDDLKNEKKNISEAFNLMHKENTDALNLITERNEELLQTKKKYDDNITNIGLVNQFLNQNSEVSSMVLESMQRDVDTMQNYCNSVDIEVINKDIENNLLQIEKLNTRISLIVNLFS